MKNNFKTASKFILEIMCFLVLGLLGCIAWYFNDINWQFTFNILGIAAPYIGLLFAINLLLLKK